MFARRPIIVLKFAKQGMPGRTGPMGLPGQDAISWEAVVTMEGVKNGECTIKLYKDGKLANNEIHYAAVHVMGTRSNFYTLSNEYSRTISGTYTFQYRDVRGIFVIIYEDSFAENVLTAATATMIRGRDVKILQCAPLTFTAAEWRAKGAKGVSNVWTTGATYDNSELEDGDTVIISGTVSDQLDQHDVAVSGMILGKAQIPMGADASQSVTVVSQTFVIGPAGAAATVQVGTVTTLPYDADATVVNSGTANNAVLDFGIPQGTPGEAVNSLPFNKITGSPTDNTALSNALNGKADASHSHAYLPTAGGAMSGAINMAGTDLNLKTPNSSSDDSGDIVWYYGNGKEKMRIWSSDTYTAVTGPKFRIYKNDGTSLYSGSLALGNHTHNKLIDTGNANYSLGMRWSGESTNNFSYVPVWDDVSGYTKVIGAMSVSNFRSKLGLTGIALKPDYSISTTDLTAGTSALTNNQIYFVYA